MTCTLMPSPQWCWRCSQTLKLRKVNSSKNSREKDLSFISCISHFYLDSFLLTFLLSIHPFSLLLSLPSFLSSVFFSFLPLACFLSFPSFTPSLILVSLKFLFLSFLCLLASFPFSVIFLNFPPFYLYSFLPSVYYSFFIIVFCLLILSSFLL